MKCVADVVFLGIRSSVSRKNGQTYYNVDFRSDGRNMTLGTRSPSSFSVFEEFQPIQITIDLFTWNNSLIGNIVGAQALSVPKINTKPKGV